MLSQLHGHPDRNMQSINLSRAFRMLEFPHPLLSNYIDMNRVHGSPTLADKEIHAPDEDDDHNDNRDNCPRELQRDVAVNLLRNFVGSTAPILDGKNQQQKKDQCRKKD